MIKCKTIIGKEERNIAIEIGLMSIANVKYRRSRRTLSLIIGLTAAVYSISYLLENSLFAASIFLEVALFCIIYGIRIKNMQRRRLRNYQKKQNKEIISGEIEYEFTNEGIHITNILGSGINYWNAFESYGDIEHYLYIMRKDNSVILVDKNTIYDDEMNELYMLVENNIERY